MDRSLIGSGVLTRFLYAVLTVKDKAISLFALYGEAVTKLKVKSSNHT